MRRLILILSILLSCCFSLSAQSARYTAFSVSGNVQVKHDAVWKGIAKHMPLDAFDELMIPENGSLKILETKTNALYRNTGYGTMTVRQLISNAKSQSENSLSALTQAFTSSMGTNSTSGNTRLRVGGAHRGSSSGLSVEDSICFSIAHIANLLLEDKVQSQDNVVIGTRVFDQDTYTITLSNTSDLAYCVNVVAVNIKENKFRLLLSPGYEYGEPYVILDAHTDAVLDKMVYLSNPDELLFVFASDCLFDSELVNLMLDEFQLDDGVDLVKMHFSEIK